MKFRYKAKTKKGQSKEGTIQALSRSEANKRLLEKDLILLSLQSVKQTKTFKKIDSLMLFSGVTNLDKVLFAKHLSIMVKAGLTIREGIAAIEEQTDSKKFKKVLKEIGHHLDNGEPLGKSLANYPHIFSELFVNMIRIGEASGTLEENLNYLAEHLEKSYDLRQKIVAAAIYPSIVLVATFGLAGFLSIFILPKLIPLFKSFNVQLPLVTRILMVAIEIVQSYWLIVLISIIVLVVGIIFSNQLKPIKRLYHKIFISLPVFGLIAKNTNLAQITRTLGTLLRSGVTVVESLDITAKTTRNIIYQQSLEKTALKVRRGKSISSFLKLRPDIFPATVSRMIQVGEKSGKLDETLIYLAEFYEKEVDNTTKNLSNILEPILLVFIGLIVALVAVAIILPIYQITRSLRIS